MHPTLFPSWSSLRVFHFVFNSYSINCTVTVFLRWQGAGLICPMTDRASWGCCSFVEIPDVSSPTKAGNHRSYPCSSKLMFVLYSYSTILNPSLNSNGSEQSSGLGAGCILHSKHIDSCSFICRVYMKNIRREALLKNFLHISYIKSRYVIGRNWMKNRQHPPPGSLHSVT